MQVSRATESDLKQVQAISNDSLKSPHSIEYFRKRLSDFFYCLRDGDIVYGFIIVKNNNIDLLAVDKSERGKGYGKVIVEMVADEFENLTLKVRESNVPARKLYKRAGFLEVGFSEKKYKNGERGVIYKKEKNK